MAKSKSEKSSSSKKQGDGLSELPNVGKDLTQKLLAIGIDTPEKLRHTGTEQTYLRIKALDPGACFCVLCALEGAIRGIRWHNLPPERKEELKQFFYMAKKKE